MDNEVVELALFRAKAGLLQSQALLWTLVASTLLVATPDASYDGDLSRLKPLLLRGDDQDLLAVFTNPKWIGRFAQIAQAYVPMAGRDIIISLPANTGIVVNPESDLGFELPWQGVAALRNELRIP